MRLREWLKEVFRTASRLLWKTLRLPGDFAKTNGNCVRTPAVFMAGHRTAEHINMTPVFSVRTLRRAVRIATRADLPGRSPFVHRTANERDLA